MYSGLLIAVSPRWEIGRMCPEKEQPFRGGRVGLLICRVKHWSQSTKRYANNSQVTGLFFHFSLSFSELTYQCCDQRWRFFDITTIKVPNSLKFWSERLPGVYLMQINVSVMELSLVTGQYLLMTDLHLLTSPWARLRAALFAEHLTNLERKNGLKAPFRRQSDVQGCTRRRVQVFRSQNTATQRSPEWQSAEGKVTASLPCQRLRLIFSQRPASH